MKKVLAILLSALMLVSALTACGTPAATETPAPAATEAPSAAEAPAAETPAASGDSELNLRPGEAVDVTDVQSFYTAYVQCLDPNSGVNMIRLNTDINAQDKVEKFPEGTDPAKVPHLTDVGYFVFRMPEGTALDLAGYKLKLRGIQGLDDETGARSNLVTLGKVIDSFGGGSIELVAWKDNDHMVSALKVAADYPEFINTISISKGLSDSAECSYTIPENVELVINNANANLVCDTLTFKSGATLTIGEKSEIGITGTKNVIFECKTAEDKTRAGIEYATEIKDV